MYILVYGFIYFFTVQISWKIFSRCQFGFFFSFWSLSIFVVVLSIGDQSIIFSPFGA